MTLKLDDFLGPILTKRTVNLAVHRWILAVLKETDCGDWIDINDLLEGLNLEC